ncbi:MAG: pyridoxal phosphate-dependent aminotransferase [Flavobacteriales bacterium]|nr:pyridoxal phosphate-dependent aminotransferase [Flavobacteriales bacterium]MCZ2443983.1 pyridoxal phosphate-dependent aminotransferase [Flavobacteriales bacterium]
MPSISEKGRSMPASPIRRLVPYADAARSRGLTVYQLNIGQPDIHTPDVALQAVKSFSQSIIEYSHSAGNLSYRNKLAAYYQGMKMPVTADQLLITTGGSEALLFALMSCLNEEDELIVPEPFYANYISFAITAGVRIVPITARIENGFALPEIDAFEEKITDRTKAILICNPSNPTGYLYTEEELMRLREIVLRHDLFLFADEVYREFVYDGRKHISTFELPGLENHLVVVDSISKRYSMCGARIGALLTRNEEVYQTCLKFAQARLSPPTFGQIAGEAALDTPSSYFDEVVTEYEARRNYMVELLNQIQGVLCPRPGGAFYSVARLPVENAEDFCIWMLKEFEYKKQTVMMAPASGFYVTPGMGRDEVRLAYVLNRDKIGHAMECLAHGLRAYQTVMQPA